MKVVDLKNKSRCYIVIFNKNKIHTIILKEIYRRDYECVLLSFDTNHILKDNKRSKIRMINES